MAMFGISREQIAETTLTNLVQAGVIKPDEVEPGRRLLDDYSDGDLTRLLVISHEVRELVIRLESDLVMPFFLITEINLN